MITKQRLQELIKQEATIYDLFKGDIYLVDLTMVKYWKDVNYIEYYNDYYNCNLTRNEDDLFETKEDAKWELEFKNITRTETLRLPSWEEMESKEESIICKFLAKDLYWYAIMQFNGKQGWVVYNMNTNKIIGKFLKRTKENYIETCRLAKKLFLGESK